ncbi:unnamed protein product, partial [Prorocentrum cordatum]
RLTEISDSRTAPGAHRSSRAPLDSPRSTTSVLLDLLTARLPFVRVHCRSGAEPPSVGAVPRRRVGFHTGALRILARRLPGRGRAQGRHRRRGGVRRRHGLAARLPLERGRQGRLPVHEHPPQERHLPEGLRGAGNAGRGQVPCGRGFDCLEQKHGSLRTAFQRFI